MKKSIWLLTAFVIAACNTSGSSSSPSTKDTTSGGAAGDSAGGTEAAAGDAGETGANSPGGAPSNGGTAGGPQVCARAPMCPKLVACEKAHCHDERVACFGAGYYLDGTSKGACAPVITCSSACPCDDNFVSCSTNCSIKNYPGACATCNEPFAQCMTDNCQAESAECAGLGAPDPGGAGGAGGAPDPGGDACMATQADTACEGCIKQQCCSELGACPDGSACAELASCISACPDTANTCIEDCVAAHGAGASAYTQLYGCTVQSCTECN